LTANGRLDGFSSKFTRTAGLEVVQPIVESFKVQTAPSAANPQCELVWDCENNPPGTSLSMEIVPPVGAPITHSGLPRQGMQTFSAAATGTFSAVLTATLTFNGQTRHAKKTLHITGV
jgi:hypothetical protein